MREQVGGAPRASREREVIAAFGEITGEALTTAGPEDLLGLVGKGLCRLLGVGRCSVYLRGNDGRFRGAAGYCESEGDISAAVRAQEAGVPGDRFSREVISSAAPVLISDVPGDPRPHRRTMEYWRVRSMLGVPLVSDDEVIGLIFVDDVAREHVYTDEDVVIAGLFARLGALFLRQAMLAARLRGQAAELARQKDALAHQADTHRRLTDAVLDGADIATVVRLVSDLAAKPVVLYGEDFDVLAWAAPARLRMTDPPVLPDRIRAIPSVARTLRSLAASRPSAVVPQTLAIGLGRRHLMCRLVIEGAASGYLGVVEVGRSLQARDSTLAEHGATVLSLQILSERRQAEAQGQAREDYLSDLLRSTSDPEQLARRGPRFGIDPSEPHVLVRFALDGDASQLGSAAARRMVADGVARRLGIADPPAVGLPGAVVVLLATRLPGGRTAGPDELRDDIDAVRTGLDARLPIRVAVVSGVCRETADLPAAHRELREIDDLARAFGWDAGVRTADELGVLRVAVGSGRVREAVHFAHTVVRPLDGYDPALLATWRAFVAAGAKVPATAAALGVHDNTVRYRLGRIREIVGQDPAGLDSLLAARLAFQILDLAGS